MANPSFLAKGFTNREGIIVTIDESNELEAAKCTKTREEAEAYMRAYRDSVQWREAKTYSKTAPHEYHWMTDLADQRKLIEFARCVWKYGYPQDFYKKTFYYYNLDGLKYWAHPEIAKTDSYNRTAIENVYG